MVGGHFVRHARVAHEPAPRRVGAGLSQEHYPRVREPVGGRREFAPSPPSEELCHGPEQAVLSAATAALATRLETRLIPRKRAADVDIAQARVYEVHERLKVGVSAVKTCDCRYTQGLY